MGLWVVLYILIPIYQYSGVLIAKICFSNKLSIILSYIHLNVSISFTSTNHFLWSLVSYCQWLGSTIWFSDFFCFFSFIMIVVSRHIDWTLHHLVSSYTDWTLQVNKSQSPVTLKFDGKEFHWEVGECLVQKLETKHFVRQVFPLHGMLTNHKTVWSSGLIWIPK